jgi:predicted SnoaL-like aldol condensation-catalyzing enzyme
MLVRRANFEKAILEAVPPALIHQPNQNSGKDCITRFDNSVELNKPSNQLELKKIIREIGSDFRTLLADAQVRGMEQQAAVIQSFDSPLREEVMPKLYEEWPKLYNELLGHLKVGESAAELISQTLHNMEPINRFFLKVSLGELNKFFDYK